MDTAPIIATRADITSAPPELDTTPSFSAPEKVTFSDIQQAKVNALIKESMGKAAKDLRTELVTLQAASAAMATELGLYKQNASPELIQARQELAGERVARTAAEGRQLDAERNVMLRSALEAEGVHSIDDAVLLLQSKVKWASGNQYKLTSTDGLQTLEETVRDFANSRPHMVRSTVRAGTGSFDNASSTSSVPDRQLETYFGKTSSSKAANDLALSKPVLFKALRERAKDRGLI